MLHDLVYQLSTHFFPSLVFAIVLAIASVEIAENGFISPLKKVGLWKWLFFVYVSFILFTTILGRSVIKQPLSGRFQNFWPIGSQEIENILVFIPLTFFFLMAYKPERIRRTGALFSVFFSLGIELGQILTRLGLFQFSDILYNVIGGLIGNEIYILVVMIVKLRNQKKE